MHNKVIVIGGGIAGASITRALAKRGVQVTLLERSKQLCSGATWHAAGLVTRFGGSPKLKKLHVQSLAMLREIHDAEDVGLHLTGSIRIVHKNDPDRLLEAKHHVELARLYDEADLPTRLIGTDEIKALHPLIDTGDVEAGVYTPMDGDIDPTLLTTHVAKLAKQDGAEIVFGADVKDIDRRGQGEFVVTTHNGHAYTADGVVNATGLWSQEFSQQLGLPHPAMVLEHHYIITEPVAGLDARNRLPVLRDLRGSSYIRQERTGFLIGPYEDTVAIKRQWPAGPPKDWEWGLFDDNLYRLEQNLGSAFELIPVLAEVGTASVVNGPTIWTGDSLPRCGRTPIPGYYDFNTLTYGIAHSLPLSEYLAHIMLEGEQAWDLSAEADPLRYWSLTDKDYTHDKIFESYSHNNRIVYPFEHRPAGREHLPGYNAALPDILRKAGGVMGFSMAGGEFPLFYTPKGEEVEMKSFHSHAWARYAEAEAAHVRSSVGLSHANFSKIRVSSGASDAATRLLDIATTNTLPKVPGACVLSYCTTPKGKVLAEFTITRESNAHDYYLIGSRDYAAHDVEWLKQQARVLLPEADIRITDESANIEILHVAGPKAGALVGALHEPLAQLRFLKSTKATVLGVEATVFRVSFTGEAGYEFHVAAGDAAALYEKIAAHPKAAELDCKPFGSHALNSLRLEKGFLTRGDIDYAAWDEVGIERFVDISKDFLGKAAGGDPTRRRGIFLVHTAAGFEWSIPSDCPVKNAAGDIVGFTTSSAFGGEVGKAVALGYIKYGSDGAPLAAVGEDGLTVEVYGQHFPVESVAAPPVPVRGLKKKKKKSPATVTASPAADAPPAKSSTACQTEGFYTENVRKELETAYTLPPELYFDKDVFEVEKKKVWEAAWVLIGTTLDWREEGTVKTMTVGTQPLVITKAKDGKIRAFKNVCRHRGNMVCDKKQQPLGECGKHNTLVCRYHRWCYALDGRLLAAPLFTSEEGGKRNRVAKGPTEDEVAQDKNADPEVVSKAKIIAKNFDKNDFGLIPVRLETFGHLVFVNVDGENPATLREYLGCIADQLSEHEATWSDLDNMVSVAKVEYTSKANWKLLCENYQEYYHLPSVHPALCEVSVVNDHKRCQGAGANIAFKTHPLTNGGTPIDPEVFPALPTLTGENLETAYHHYVFPNMFVFNYPHSMFVIRLEIDEVGVTREYAELVMHKSATEVEGFEEKAKKMCDFYDMINLEDIDICENVQVGIQAKEYKGGRFSFRFEETVHRFQNLYADYMTRYVPGLVPPGDETMRPGTARLRPAAGNPTSVLHI
eukprot:TRINITY_DN442_c0_g2_i1.p1 TRINITY_DN442_c0_g2~~TRINITY_DN442_c0_g2_i1.p1  ORF type:complete len:1298 (+),score=497.22 TRINITY_DN442_c0_g2_i1:111-4004(+)